MAISSPIYDGGWQITTDSLIRGQYLKFIKWATWAGRCDCYYLCNFDIQEEYKCYWHFDIQEEYKCYWLALLPAHFV